MFIVTSTFGGGCDMTIAGMTTCCVTLYAPGPGVIKLGSEKRLVFIRREMRRIKYLDTYTILVYYPAVHGPRASNSATTF